MRLDFTAHITAADAETRTLRGLIVPFEKPGNTSAGPVQFAAGSLTNLEPGAVKLLKEHSHTDPLGKATCFEVTPAGIVGTFKVAATHAGDDILVEAAEGLRDGFSVGANLTKYTTKNGVINVTAAELVEVSVVANPAFNDARITDVAASESPEEVPTTEEKEEPVENITPEVVDTPVVEAASDPAPVQAAAPIYTKPRYTGMTSGEYVFHKVNAAMGNHESMLLVTAADDDTTTNTGLTLPGHMNEFIVNTFASRPAVDALGGTRALPASGMTFTIPRLTAAPTVDIKGEGVAPSETGMTSDYITVTIAKHTGLNRVSFELMDRSAPMFGDLLLRELQKAYAKSTDAAVLAKLVSGGTAASNQSADWAGLQAFIATEAPIAYKETGGDVANVLIANTDWWTALIGAVDSADRPVFNALAPSNAGGTVGIGQPRGTVFGTDLWIDHNISASGLIDDSAFLVAPAAVGLWESPTTQLRVNVLTTGEIELNLYGYFAVEVLKAKGVREFMIA